ncbi:LytR C-terminal domain-containing protein [Streptomyces sp. NPDC005925]|uniref:LytR C-terminal domain-containing protein n=1 Tax=Streptomyces sp. NPDC005925 TaxID=3157172 RepID=UPI0034032212
MGGQYRITGDKYPRMRRRRGRRMAVITVACAAALGLLGWGTLQLIDVFTGGDKASAAGSAEDCPPGASASPSPGVPAALPAPGTIKVNVLNATTRSGLAKKTADELKKRGFRIGEVGNASKKYDKKVKGTGILLGPTTALKTSLQVLGTQLTAAEPRTDAARKGVEVDLIIGDAFKKLTPEADASKALTKLTHPAPAPTNSRKGC